MIFFDFRIFLWICLDVLWFVLFSLIFFRFLVVFFVFPGFLGFPLNCVDSLAFHWFSIVVLHFLWFRIDVHWISLICMYVALSCFDDLAIHHPHTFLYSFLWNIAVLGASMRMARFPEVRASGPGVRYKGSVFLTCWLANLSLFLLYRAWGLVWGS